MNIYNPSIVGPTTSDSSFTGTSFIKTSATSVQFLMGDGSVRAFGTTAGTIAEGNHLHTGVYATSSHTHAYEPIITGGTTAQYWRGDKTWQTLPTPGTGLVLSGTVFNHSNVITAGNFGDTGVTRALAYSGTFVVPYVTYDAQGHITGITNKTMTLPAASGGSYTQGTGITITGSVINHTNAVTASNTGDTGATRTLAWSGTFTIPYITYDAQGHITGAANRVITIPANPNVDTNTYPTTYTWTGGTTAGPTGSLTGTSPAVSFAAIPSASVSESGIVTTGAQSFAGDKTFTGVVKVKTASVITGTGTGNGNLAILNFTESNGTTIQGYVGKGSAGTGNIGLVNTISNKYLMLDNNGSLSYDGPVNVTGNVLGSNTVTNELDIHTGTAKVSQIITCTLTEYNAIGTKNANTLYVII